MNGRASARRPFRSTNATPSWISRKTFAQTMLAFNPVPKHIWRAHRVARDSRFSRAVTESSEMVNLGKKFQELSNNIDFSALGDYSKWASRGDREKSWFASFLPKFDELFSGLLPQNLREIDDITLREVEGVVMLGGIGLYNVPRTRTAEALVRAGSPSERRKILGDRWKSISADCRVAMGACDAQALAPYVSATLAALDALDGGHTQASQALIGSIADSILTSYLSDSRRFYTPSKSSTNINSYYELNVKKFIALAPMWQAYQQFWVKEGDRVPTVFNRNATAHTVSNRQYSRRNAVQGLLFVCGLITFLDELIKRRESSQRR